MRAGRGALARLADALGNSELQRLIAQREAALDVSRPAPLIGQPTDASGWSAALAMLISQREGRMLSGRDIAARAGLSVDDTYGWSEVARAIASWGLRTAPPAVWTPQPWSDLLARLGPLLIIHADDPSCAVVLAAINGDGTAGETLVTLLNPGPSDEGSVERVTFQEFAERYGPGTGRNAQVIHA